MRLLVVSDDFVFAEQLKYCLETNYYSVDIGKGSEQGSYWARTTEYDLIIIDHNSKTHAGEIAKNLRDKNKLMPILVIVQKLSSKEAVELYNSGIDDYASKYIPQVEITAKVRALLRRPITYTPEIFKVDDLILDSTSYQVSRGNKTIYLTRKEFALLEYMLRFSGRVLSRTDLIEHVWDINADLFSNTLETHILNLRKKIEHPNKPKLIHTISGRGYKLAIT